MYAFLGKLGFEFIRCVLLHSQPSKIVSRPPEKVFCLAADDTPFLWIGTDNGLRRFDGTRFKSYTHIDGDSTSLNENTVRKIIVSENGHLWVATADGLHQYSPLSDSFKLIELPGLDFHGYILDMVADGHEGVWFIVAGLGLFHASFSEKKAIPVYIPDRDKADMIRMVVKDHNEDIWMSAENSNKVIRFSVKDGSITDFIIPDISIKYIMADREGIPVVVTDGEIFRFNYGRRSFIKDNVRTRFIDFKEFSNNLLNSSVVPVSGRIVSFDQDNRFLTLDKMDIDSALYLTSSVISTDGTLWLGATDHGILRMDQRDSTVRFIEYDKIGAVSGSMSFPTACVSNNNDTVWFALSNKKIVSVSVNGKINDIININGVPEALVASDDNRLFVWENGIGLCEYESHRHNGKVLFKFPGDESCRSLVYDGVNTIYGAIAGSGVFSFALDTNNIEWFTDKNSGLANNWVSTLYQFDDSSIIIGHSGGVSIMNPLKSEIHSIPDSVGLNKVLCHAITSDINGNIWIGTNRGLFACMKDGTYRKYSMSNGLSDETVLYVCGDSKGNIWCFSAAGIDRLDVNTSMITDYSGSKSLSDRIYGNGLATVTSDGIIIIPGSKGFTCFNTSEMDDNVFDGSIILSDLYIMDKLITAESLSGGKRVLNKTLDNSDIIELSHKDNSFSILLSVGGIHKPDNVTYEYRLDGRDRQWIRLPHGKSVLHFHDIEPGIYILHIRAFENGTYSTERKIRIVVRRPLYASAGAVTLYIAILSIIVFFILCYRLRRKSKQSDGLNSKDSSNEIDILTDSKKVLAQQIMKLFKLIYEF